MEKCSDTHTVCAYSYIEFPCTVCKYRYKYLQAENISKHQHSSRRFKMYQPITASFKPTLNKEVFL